MFSNGVQEEDVRGISRVTSCQEVGPMGRIALRNSMEASGIVKKKKTSYGFAAFRFNISKVRSLHF